MATQKRGSKVWRGRIEACRKERKKREEVWKTNVAYRKGKPFSMESESDRIAVPIDWSMTKAKVASLFSQVPAVQLTAKNPQYAPAVPIFAKELNDVLKNSARVDVAMEEVLSDVVNAAGIGAVKVGYSATFEDIEVPAIDPAMLPPEAQMALSMGAFELPMETVKRPVSERFYANRISPASLLWPVEFKGSDFDDAPWIGWEGSLTWAQAKREFGLKDSQKDDVLSSAGTEVPSLREDDLDEQSESRHVRFCEIFYKASEYDPECLYFDKLRRIVFVEGLDEPVIHEDLAWQQFDDETGSYVGVCKFPIRVLTLTYISDEAIPPSDSEVGRPQVDETMRSRSQMVAQRDRSVPIRWADTNRIDPLVMDNLQKGNWQGFIPINGPGERAIGEVARATYPREDWEFDRVTKSDLQEAWQVGANQTGSFASGERSAAEARIVQGNFQTRVGVERAKVAKFFVSIAETLAGLMQLFYDPPERASLVGGQAVQRSDAAWDRSKVAGAKFVFTIRPDSTVLLDANQRVDQLMKFVNLTGKSGFVNVEPVIAEIAALSGLDPAEVMVKPQPPKPDDTNISFRFSGVEDLMNPLAVALIQKQQNVTPDEIKAAKALIADATAPPQPPVVSDAPIPNGPQLPPAPPDDWGPMPRVTKRVEELGG
jgi:hypothetical protein